MTHCVPDEFCWRFAGRALRRGRAQQICHHMHDQHHGLASQRGLRPGVQPDPDRPGRPGRPVAVFAFCRLPRVSWLALRPFSGGMWAGVRYFARACRTAPRSPACWSSCTPRALIGACAYTISASSDFGPAGCLGTAGLAACSAQAVLRLQDQVRHAAPCCQVPVRWLDLPGQAPADHFHRLQRLPVHQGKVILVSKITAQVLESPLSCLRSFLLPSTSCGC